MEVWDIVEQNQFQRDVFGPPNVAGRGKRFSGQLQRLFVADPSFTVRSAL